jgi:hypothetical protein
MNLATSAALLIAVCHIRCKVPVSRPSVLNSTCLYMKMSSHLVGLTVMRSFGRSDRDAVIWSV